MAQQPWPEREEEILALWDRERVFEQSVARDAAKGEFVFYDGPPTANAPPGMHHAEPQTYKDVIPRYKTMRGYRVRRKAGWDTHGLPVELQIEKKLGLKTKKDVEAYGIAPFNAACRDSVWEFKGDWERLKHRMGSWMDMRNPYVTYEMPFIESVWWFLKQAWEKGLLSRDYRSVWYCPRCQTPLSSHEVALGYKDDVEDPSVFIKFQILNSKFQIPGNAPAHFLAWTTTPWTLPGNVALAVHPEVEYAVVRHHGDHLILARPLVERVLGADAEIVQTVQGRDLVGTRYEPLYRLPISPLPAGGGARGGGDDSKKTHTVLPADFVSLEDGTGIVHIAPAYGGEDFELGKAHGIPPLFTVQQNGTVMEGFPGAGKFFKSADADVRADLTARGLLFRDEKIRHTYPFCWRCDTPLLAYARSSWYITMSKLRAEIQAKNQTIHWLPEHIKDGRFGEWLRELKDWAITRERYWGAPIPIWECDRCQHREILGSFAELIAKAPKRNHFILMRHGEAESNARCVISSKLATSDQYPLTDAGRKRVTKAAESLKEVGITKIIASPFHRMRQTAEIVSAAVGVSVTYDERLREIDLPDFDGKSCDAHNAVFSQDQQALEKFSKKVGENETWNELAKRMLTTLKSIDEQHDGQTILICTHGDPLFLLEWAFSGRTREGIQGMPYPTFDAPHAFPFTGSLVNDRGELDLHRPFIDGITWSCAKDGCSGAMKRFPEVVDVWLESGCMPFAQHHYPFEDRRGGVPSPPGRPWQAAPTTVAPPPLYPADYISEAIDQTRGWFYTLLAVATVLGWDAPYKNVIVLGHLLDAKGQKMSKSKGNVVKPLELIARYGADVVRWYMVTVNQAWDPKLFDEADLKTMSNKPFGTLRNLLSFWELHGGGTPAAWSDAHDLDTWLRARFASLHHDATEHLEAYRITDAARGIGEAIDDLSTWWLQLSRERLKEGDESARATFAAALETLAVLLAPLAPFHSEHIWRILRERGVLSPVSLRGDQGDEAISPTSVHLARWDDYAPPGTAENGPQRVTDDAIRTKMGTTRAARSIALEKRAAEGIPVRQVLTSITMSSKYSDVYRTLLAKAVNVKEVAIDPKFEADDVALDTTLTPELKREGMVRELTRAVNNIRKEMGLTPSDRIRVTYHTDDAELTQAITEQQAQIERAVVAANFSPSQEGEREGGRSAAHELHIGTATLTLDIAKES